MAEQFDPDFGLPTYASPPVVETILGVQFDRLAKLKNAHLGAFWKTLGADWPNVSDQPPIPEQTERFEESAAWADAPQISFNSEFASRLQIRNAEADRMIQLQNGRFHYNWMRQDSALYPRYNVIRPAFEAYLTRFMTFIQQEGLGKFRPNQWETTYINQIPEGTIWQTPSDWGFFRPLAHIPSIDSVIQAEGFTGEWTFLIPDRRGRLHVSWQRRLRRSDSKSVIALTFTARGPIPSNGSTVENVLTGVDLGRRTIVKAFAGLSSAEANQAWGLKNAGD